MTIYQVMTRFASCPFDYPDNDLCVVKYYRSDVLHGINQQKHIKLQFSASTTTHIFCISYNSSVARWPSGQDAGFAINRSRVWILVFPLLSATLGKLLTHTCLCHQAVQFGTSQSAVMPCGWEGSHRSGIALATYHRHYWISTYGLGEGDEHPPTLS